MRHKVKTLFRDSGLNSRIKDAINLFSSKKQASEVAGVTVEQLNRYCKGESTPSFTALSRLAGAVGVSLEWLATGEGEMRPAGSQSTPPADGDGIPQALKPDGAPDDWREAMSKDWFQETLRQFLMILVRLKLFRHHPLDYPKFAAHCWEEFQEKLDIEIKKIRELRKHKISTGKKHDVRRFLSADEKFLKNKDEKPREEENTPPKAKTD